MKHTVLMASLMVAVTVLAFTETIIGGEVSVSVELENGSNNRDLGMYATGADVRLSPQLATSGGIWNLNTTINVRTGSDSRQIQADIAELVLRVYPTSWAEVSWTIQVPRFCSLRPRGSTWWT